MNMIRGTITASKQRVVKEMKEKTNNLYKYFVIPATTKKKSRINSVKFNARKRKSNIRHISQFNSIHTRYSIIDMSQCNAKNFLLNYFNLRFLGINIPQLNIHLLSNNTKKKRKRKHKNKNQ